MHKECAVRYDASLHIVHIYRHMHMVYICTVVDDSAAMRFSGVMEKQTEQKSMK